MKWFDKILNWSTNQDNEYIEESSTYDMALTEIHSIEDLLECCVENEDFFDNMEVHDLRIMAKSLKDAICMYRKKAALALAENERIIIQSEILQLEREYKQLIIKIKEELLSFGIVTEINKHVVELNVIIKRNARFIVFQKYLDFKKWTTSDLENLKNEIYIRNAVLLPYLGRLK